MQRRIIERVQKNPESASAWRMLGRVQTQRGDLAGAEKSFRKAAELGPLNAAVHYDLGQTLLDLDREREALEYFERTVELAPESEYAESARTYLNLWGIEPPDPGEAVIELVSHEEGEFDGSSLPEDDLGESVFQPLTDPRDAIDFSLDVGLRYNSNVALAPTSRQLVPGDRESFQLLLSPDLEWTLADTGADRVGVLYYGRHTFNEGNFREFNLGSYQPGLFWERTIDDGETLWIPRLNYEFIHDEFDGTTFANRHQITASLFTIWDDINSTFGYWSTDVTAFNFDGSTPALTSQDGWNNILGVSHRWDWNDEFFRGVRIGGDVRRADTDGRNFRFNGIQLFAEAGFVPAEDWVVTLETGWGYRDYFDFVGSPTRDEHNWKAGIEAERQITDRFSVTLRLRYQQFDSKNALFDADRLLGGVVSTFDF